jgi:hypothetical protein
MIDTTLTVDGQAWRVKAKSLQAAYNEIAHARVIGSVGSSTTIYNGGKTQLIAEVHKIDTEGKDIQPS